MPGTSERDKAGRMERSAKYRQVAEKMAMKKAKKSKKFSDAYNKWETTPGAKIIPFLGKAKKKNK